LAVRIHHGDHVCSVLSDQLKQLFAWGKLQAYSLELEMLIQ
jgi:hypothetical protein